MRTLPRLSLAASVAQKVRRAAHTIQGKRFVHLLHIGKTGGTAVKQALQPYTTATRNVIYLERHAFTLRHVPVGDGIIFFLRDPIARFVSGFYSRQRQGLPMRLSAWRPEEKIAFEHFDSPNKVGLALSSPDPEARSRAEQAMRGIEHVNESYWDWFESTEYFMSRARDILLIGFQESLAEDFERLKRILGLPAEAALPRDDVKAHKNPENLDKRLEPTAVANLEQWYREDYRFMELCRPIVAAQREADEKSLAQRG